MKVAPFGPILHEGLQKIGVPLPLTDTLHANLPDAQAAIERWGALPRKAGDDHHHDPDDLTAFDTAYRKFWRA
ncbi:MAG: hypothetical protein EOO77_30210 [Oxalobacteraceae bacterium]|nr:MAG: hypothetical protein EOO77_30210 [Oxalobacteraceae bacterium]